MSNEIFTVCLTSKQSDREAAGFTGGCPSTDGTLIIGGKGDTEQLALFSDTPMPSYYSEEDYPNWPYLIQSEAITLIGVLASTEGGSNGYSYSGGN